MSLETRISKLELQITEDIGVSDVNLELYDRNGEQVKAKIKIMPKTWEKGVAILQDGTEKEIACEGNWTDVILASEEILNEREYGKTFNNEAEQKDCLVRFDNNLICPFDRTFGISVKRTRHFRNGCRNGQKDYFDNLFLRRNGQISATESLFTMCDFQTDIRRENGLLQNLAHN